MCRPRGAADLHLGAAVRTDRGRAPRPGRPDAPASLIAPTNGSRAHVVERHLSYGKSDTLTGTYSSPRVTRRACPVNMTARAAPRAAPEGGGSYGHGRDSELRR